MKTKNSTKQQRSCRLVEFLVFNSIYWKKAWPLFWDLPLSRFRKVFVRLKTMVIFGLTIWENILLFKNIGMFKCHVHIFECFIYVVYTQCSEPFSFVGVTTHILRKQKWTTAQRTPMVEKIQTGSQSEGGILLEFDRPYYFEYGPFHNKFWFSIWCIFYFKCAKKKKNGDTPGPLGDFVKSLVTERLFLFFLFS